MKVSCAWNKSFTLPRQVEEALFGLSALMRPICGAGRCGLPVDGVRSLSGVRSERRPILLPGHLCQEIGKRQNYRDHVENPKVSFQQEGRRDHATSQ